VALRNTAKYMMYVVVFLVELSFFLVYVLISDKVVKINNYNLDEMVYKNDRKKRIIILSYTIIIITIHKPAIQLLFIRLRNRTAPVLQRQAR
jgi:uncharacterized membrane protein (Fun14 family)